MCLKLLCLIVTTLHPGFFLVLNVQAQDSIPVVNPGSNTEICLQKDAAAEVPGVLQLSLKLTSMSDEALELLAWVLDDPTFKLCTKNKSEV